MLQSEKLKEKWKPKWKVVKKRGFAFKAMILCEFYMIETYIHNLVFTNNI